MKAYLGGPFFNSKQVAIIDRIQEICNSLGVKTFNPKEECIFVPGQTDPKKILDDNLAAIDSSDIIIAVTDDKDSGTMFESGYAYATKTPIVYVWLGGSSEDKFNLMLNESATTVCRSYDDVMYYLSLCIRAGSIVKRKSAVSKEDLQ